MPWTYSSALPNIILMSYTLVKWTCVSSVITQKYHKPQLATALLQKTTHLMSLVSRIPTQSFMPSKIVYTGCLISVGYCEFFLALDTKTCFRLWKILNWVSWIMNWLKMALLPNLMVANSRMEGPYNSSRQSSSMQPVRLGKQTRSSWPRSQDLPERAPLSRERSPTCDHLSVSWWQAAIWDFQDVPASLSSMEK